MKKRWTYLLNSHVRGDGGSNGSSVTGDDVDDTGREDLGDEAAKEESGERGLLGGLEDNAISGSESRTELPTRHEDGEVP